MTTAIDIQEQKAREFREADRLWKLLEMALADFSACEGDPDHYEVDMGTWLCQGGHGKCIVCLGGAAIAQHLDLKHLLALGQADRDTPWQAGQPNYAERMHILDELRCGYVAYAWHRLHYPSEAIGTMAFEALPKHFQAQVAIPAYGMDNCAWWAAMEQLLIQLKENDL